VRARVRQRPRERKPAPLGVAAGQPRHSRQDRGRKGGDDEEEEEEEEKKERKWKRRSNLKCIVVRELSSLLVLGTRVGVGLFMYCGV
jgi:hypothetical protein